MPPARRSRRNAFTAGSVQIRGMAELQRNIRRLANSDRVAKRLAKTLYQEATKVMGESKRDEVPVDTGVLRSTGHVQPPRVLKAKVDVTLGYGGPAAPYALEQHERTDFHHDHGKAKYLEDPWVRALPRIHARLREDALPAMGDSIKRIRPVSAGRRVIKESLG